MTRKRKPAPPALPASHLEALQRDGFEVVRWQSTSVECRCSDGRTRGEWLPKTFINWDKRQVAEWFEAGQGNYSFAGWETSQGHTFGGRYDTVAGALGWFHWLQDTQGGKTMQTNYTHRIRRCKNNKDAWCLVALCDDGSELTSGGFTTALSIDDLLRYSRGLLPTPDDVVQIVYLSPESD